MKQCKKVSIIIPVFNMEKYLSECIESLLVQTYQNIEIVLIDDVSTDQSLEICNHYAKQDSRIRVIAKEKNGGAASARNLGIDESNGEFICFVDSDDYVKPNFIQNLMEHIIGYDADIAACSFVSFDKNKEVPYLFHTKKQVFDKYEYLKEFLEDWSCALACNKMFRSSLLQGVRYEEGHKIDDEYFTYKLVMKANKVVQFEQGLYYYRMRLSSVTKTAENSKLLLMDRIDFFVKRYANITKNLPELKVVFLENLVNQYIWFFRSETLDKDCSGLLRKNILHNFTDFAFGNYSYKLKLWILYYLFRPVTKVSNNLVERDIVAERNQFYE